MFFNASSDLAFGNTYDKFKIKNLISGSYAFAVAIDIRIQKAIGMGRLLSDGIADAYIQDLVVHPQYQGSGIGKKMINSLIQYCLSHGIRWIGLIAEPGNNSFYKSLGFKPMKDHTPMLYQLEE